MRAHALFPILLVACSESVLRKDPKPNTGVSPGEIFGRVCSADGLNWLADAAVYTHVTDDDGRLVDIPLVYTDLDGRFQLVDLPGDREYTVYAQYGDEIVDSWTVEVGDGETVELPEPDCFDPTTVSLAIVTGDYDDFELVLSNMGFSEYTLVDGMAFEEISTFLLDSKAMAAYDVIFFNGGHIEENIVYAGEAEEGEEKPVDYSDAVLQNVRDYVGNGGSIYVSDWAYDLVERGWPDAINFIGEDEEPDAAQVGEYGFVTAAVSDESLADWLGTNYIEVEYDLPVWPPIEDTSAAVSTHLSGNVVYTVGTESYTLAGSPMLVSFTSGEGRVAFSTFRVAENAGTEIMLTLQYMMYNL